MRTDHMLRSRRQREHESYMRAMAARQEAITTRLEHLDDDLLALERLADERDAQVTVEAKVPAGLTPAELSLLTCHVATADMDEEATCAICLVEPCAGERLCTLACAHTFHDGCIVKWFAQSRLCPLCKCHALGEERADKCHAVNEERTSIVRSPRGVTSPFEPASPSPPPSRPPPSSPPPPLAARQTPPLRVQQVAQHYLDDIQPPAPPPAQQQQQLPSLATSTPPAPTQTTTRRGQGLGRPRDGACATCAGRARAAVSIRPIAAARSPASPRCLLADGPSSRPCFTRPLCTTAAAATAAAAGSRPQRRGAAVGSAANAPPPPTSRPPPPASLSSAAGPPVRQASSRPLATRRPGRQLSTRPWADGAPRGDFVKMAHHQFVFP